VADETIGADLGVRPFERNRNFSMGQVPEAREKSLEGFAAQITHHEIGIC
jgi:hypothetical protein